MANSTVVLMLALAYVLCFVSACCCRADILVGAGGGEVVFGGLDTGLYVMVTGVGAAGGLGAGVYVTGVVLAGFTCALQSMPSTFPGGPYWQTYVGHEQAALTAQPSLVVDFQTICVKWPVDVLHPGAAKLYSLTSLYQASTAADRLL